MGAGVLLRVSVSHTCARGSRDQRSGDKTTGEVNIEEGLWGGSRYMCSRRHFFLLSLISFASFLPSYAMCLVDTIAGPKYSWWVTLTLWQSHDVHVTVTEFACDTLHMIYTYTHPQLHFVHVSVTWCACADHVLIMCRLKSPSCCHSFMQESVWWLPWNK